MVSNMRPSKGTPNTSSTRSSQRTIGDTVGLCLHKVQSADREEMASSHNLDVCGDIDRTSHSNSDNKE
eukprot:5807061-Amphidinium_carterae.1